MHPNPESLPDITKDSRAVLAIKAALKEDIGSGDATTLALVGPDVMATGEIQAREECCVAGLNVALFVLSLLDPTLTSEVLIPNGSLAPKGSVLARFTGRARAILTAERTALNFIQRMCGTATLTHRFVEAVKPYDCLVLDTRKTTPCLRIFEKFAVRCGGGANHRFGLYDRILMKDNHRVQIVRASGKKTKLEASGGINLQTANAIAATGVDALSVGALTHSAPSVDLALEWSAI